MATRTWSYLVNTFEVNTRNTNKKAIKLFTDTDAKLDNEKADPDILVCYNLLHPVFVSYQNIYSQKQMVDGTYEGKTAGFKEVLADLNLQLRVWEGKTRAEFPEDSPTDIEIWPDKRKPFNSGEYEQRVAAVEALANKLLEYPALAALQLIVLSFYNSMEATRLVQQQTEGNSKLLSDLLENQRIITCQAMYGVLGYLMYKFRATPLQVARFFDLSLLRSKDSTVVRQGVVAGGAVVSIPVASVTIEEDTPILLTNTGAVPLRFYFADAANAQPGATYIEVNYNGEEETTAGLLGYDATHTFFNVKNNEPAGGSYEVEIG